MPPAPEGRRRGPVGAMQAAHHQRPLSRSPRPSHGHVRNAILHELLTDPLKAELGVETSNLYLGVQQALGVTDVGERGGHQPPGQPPPPNQAGGAVVFADAS
jgi:hypothetical protein